MVGNYKVITLCGSTRFKDEFMEVQKRLTLVCPNHHGIIHDRNPVFDRKKLEYLYPNGYREGLILNDHLKMAGQRD